MVTSAPMQQVKGKIFLAVQDGVMRDVLLQSLESRFPGFTEVCTDFPPADAGNIPAAFLTEKTGAVSENPRFLLLGIGDGGMPLPLRLGEILSRISRHFVRGALQGVSVGPWQLLPAESRLIPQNQSAEEVRITEKECEILLLLHGKKGGVASRQELLDSIWGYADGVETHTLETHIYRLRQKIEIDPAKPRYLLTEGVGYRLAD